MPSRFRIRGRLRDLLRRRSSLSTPPAPAPSPVSAAPSPSPAAPVRVDLPSVSSPDRAGGSLGSSGGEAIQHTRDPGSYQIKHLIVHHTVTARDATADYIRWLHTAPEPQGRGWDDIGYHYLLRQPQRGDAVEIIAARMDDGDPWIEGGEVGAHTLGGRNLDGLAIALIGNFHANPVPDAMWSALVEWLARQCRERGLTPDAVTGHREHMGNATVCPGAHLDLVLLRVHVHAEMSQRGWL